MTPEKAAIFYKELAEMLLNEMDGMFGVEWTENWLKDSGYSEEECEILGYFDSEEEN